jgi:hypothetical protein
MARTTINPTQISITGSNASSISEGALAASHVFLAQAASTSAVQTITADAMQAYFSRLDFTEAASQDEGMRITFAAASSGDLDDELLFVDSDVLTYNPSSTTLVVPHVEVGDDLFLKSDGAVLNFGAGDDVKITHDGGTGATLSSAGAFVIDGAAAVTVDSDAALVLGGASLDIDADGGAITIDATAATTIKGGTTAQLTANSGSLKLNSPSGSVDIDADGGKLTLDGSGGIDIGVESNVVVDLNASTLDIDATGTVHIDGASVSVDSTSSSNISMAASTSGTETLTIAASNSGGGAAVVDIDAGQLDIDASDWVKIDAADEIEVTTTSADGHITLHSAHTAGQAILIDANANSGSILDVDAGILTVDTQGTATHTIGGAFLLDGASTVGIQGAGTISLGTADSGTAVNIGHSTSEVTVGDNLVVTGDLTVNGTTTTVNSTTLTVDDTIIVLGQGNSATTKDLGVLLERSGSNSNVALFWDESSDYFQLYQGLAEDGSGDTFDITTGSYAELRLGNLVAAGNVDLGDATSDTITATGRFDSALVPSSDNARDLGTNALQWKDLYLNGTANLDVVDIDGATQIDATVTVGVNDTGYDVKFFGATSGSSLLWDESADDLILGGAAGLIVPDGKLTLGSTAVTSTAAEINVLDGYADASFSNTADSIVFADADASTGGSDLRRESTSDFLTAIAGDGISVVASQLTVGAPAEEFFQSASATFALSANPTAMIDNTLAVYLNGMLQLASGSVSGQTGDYYTTGSNLVMTDALDADDVLIVRYVAK